jgi:ABC-type branched-subunit amino acid transport system ATPase component
MGAGRTELCQTLFGVTPSQQGEIQVQGRTVHPKSPQEAVAAGIALITEDRQRTGLALELPIRMNITMANLGAVTKAGIVQAKKTVAERFRGKLRIRAESVEQKAGRLSGGNQQKVVIAKWLYRDTKIVLFDEPTRGIDVGAKAEVFALMDEMARAGKAILMVSSGCPSYCKWPTASWSCAAARSPPSCRARQPKKRSCITRRWASSHAPGHDPKAAAVPQPHRAVRRLGDRLAALLDRRELVQRCPPDRRHQHHGPGHDAGDRFRRH